MTTTTATPKRTFAEDDDTEHQRAAKYARIDNTTRLEEYQAIVNLTGLDIIVRCGFTEGANAILWMEKDKAHLNIDEYNLINMHDINTSVKMHAGTIKHHIRYCATVKKASDVGVTIPPRNFNRIRFTGTSSSSTLSLLQTAYTISSVRVFALWCYCISGLFLFCSQEDDRVLTNLNNALDFSADSNLEETKAALRMYIGALESAQYEWIIHSSAARVMMRVEPITPTTVRGAYDGMTNKERVLTLLGGLMVHDATTTIAEDVTTMETAAILFVHTCGKEAAFIKHRVLQPCIDECPLCKALKAGLAMTSDDRKDHLFQALSVRL